MSVISASIRVQSKRIATNVVGHGVAGLHGIHDAVALRVCPAPQELRFKHDVLVDTDGETAAASLGGISRAVYVARGLAKPGGVVGFHAAVAL